MTKTGPFTEEIAIEYVELVRNQRIVFEARPKMTITRFRRFVTPGSLHTWTWTFTPEDKGTRLTLFVVEHDAPRWERALDALTARTLSRAFSKEIRGRLARIKAAAEKRTPSTL